MKIKFSILAIITLCIITKYTSGQPNVLNFEKRISLIHKNVTDLTDIFALHDVGEFNEVYLNPEKFKDSVIQYLQSREDFENKLIALYSMTKLPLYKYIGILEDCYILYNKSKITEELIFRITFNEFDTKNIIIRRYKDPRLRKFLKRLLQSNSLSNKFKKSIRETLSGQSYHNLKITGHL